MMIAFLFLSQVGFGWAIYLSIAITQMGVEQQNLGVSGGISGCIRFAAGAGMCFLFRLFHVVLMSPSCYDDLRNCFQQELDQVHGEVYPGCCDCCWFI
jgi:hypothetical protein